MAEVYAGFLSHADDQLGRMLDYLEESGQLDNTLMVLVSDNGTSARAARTARSTRTSSSTGARTRSRERSSTSTIRHPEDRPPLPDRLAWAFNTPFRGGSATRATRAARPRRSDRLVTAPGRKAGMRTQHTHAVDVAPTICVARRRVAEVINGYHAASPSKVRASRRSLQDADAKEGLSIAMLLDARGGPSRCPATAGRHLGDTGASNAWGDFDNQRWELFNIKNDPSASAMTWPTAARSSWRTSSSCS